VSKRLTAPYRSAPSWDWIKAGVLSAHSLAAWAHLSERGAPVQRKAPRRGRGSCHVDIQWTRHHPTSARRSHQRPPGGMSAPGESSHPNAEQVGRF
jgi:hypothetical protein